MVLKLAGGIFVGVASLMSGWMARQGLSRQLRLLRELRLGLELMGQEMELHMPPMPELFETVGRQIGGEIGELFVGTAVNMASVTGRPLNIALKLQMEGMPLGISAELRAMLLELAGALGRYDLGGQARTLRLYQDRLDRMILELEGVRRQKAKAWMTASVCSGLALILLLL